MIFWYTDNSISQKIAHSFKLCGTEARHISTFDLSHKDDNIFYGIHRGCGNAMRALKYAGGNFFYMDNGYFNAKYVGDDMKKDMDGTYRIVKNDMIEPCNAKPVLYQEQFRTKYLLIPPSEYTAYFYDTTPGDWLMSIVSRIPECDYDIRTKETRTPLGLDIQNCDAVIAFNSMSVMRAINVSKPVFTTHGVIRNINELGSFPVYDIDDVRKYYKNKQCTLDTLGDIQWKSL